MAYYRVNLLENIVRSSYSPACNEEVDFLSLSPATIHQVLKKKFPTALRDYTPIQLPQVLTAAGIKTATYKEGKCVFSKKSDRQNRVY